MDSSIAPGGVNSNGNGHANAGHAASTAGNGLGDAGTGAGTSSASSDQPVPAVPIVSLANSGASVAPVAPVPAAASIRRFPSVPVWLRPALFVIGLTIALTLIMAFQFIPGQVQISEGEVAKQNIRSPQKINYISQIKTKESKDKAVLAVADIYDYDPSLAQQQKALAAAACHYQHPV
jgi:hypothetical protein